jgi:hypothetical protein
MLVDYHADNDEIEDGVNNIDNMHNIPIVMKNLQILPRMLLHVENTIITR